MFGLGLNNNGAGLVLASVVLARLPEVMLIVFLYTVIQHVVAGVVNHLTRREAPRGCEQRGRERRRSPDCPARR